MGCGCTERTWRLRPLREIWDCLWVRKAKPFDHRERWIEFESFNSDRTQATVRLFGMDHPLCRYNIDLPKGWSRKSLTENIPCHDWTAAEKVKNGGG